MSMRKILVQYIGSVLCLPELEREVEEIAIRDKDFRIIQRFVPEMTCHFLPFKGEEVKEPEDQEGVCSECSHYMHSQYDYCPHCGSKVEQC